MILHQIHRNKITGISVNDSLVAMTAYVVSNQYFMESSIAAFVDIYNSIYYNCNDAEYIYIQMQNSPIGSEERQTLSELYQILSNELDNLLSFEEFLNFKKIKSTTNDIRTENRKFHDKIIVDNKFGQLIKLMDQKKINAIPVKPFNEDKDNEDPLIEYLINILCETDHIPLLTIAPDELSDSAGFETISNNVEKLPAFFSQQLYILPDITDLSSRELGSLRDNILPKVKSFNKLVVELRKACLNIHDKPMSMDGLQTLSHNVTADISELQEIFNKINFTSNTIKSENHRYAAVNLCVSSMEMLVNHYEHNGTLEPYVADVLRDRLDMRDELSRCCVFFNIYAEDK